METGEEGAAAAAPSPLRRLGMARASVRTSVVEVRRNQLEAAHKVDHDPMTISRRIAIHLARNYKWYNPRLGEQDGDTTDDDAPAPAPTDNDLREPLLLTNESESSGEREDVKGDIEKAWWYYEHITLPRYLTNSVDEKRIKYDIAQPGEVEHDTRMYSPLTTPIDSMGDFGIGVGLYFATLKACTILLVLAGLMNISNLIFFAGSEYSGGQKNVRWFLKGSAVCTQHQWVPCQNCAGNVRLPKDELIRLQTGTNENGAEILFALKNLCDGAISEVGFVNFGTVFLVILGVLAMSVYLNRKQVTFDLDEQTAQDYSICIHNPPADAYDPQEWRDFFHGNFADCDEMHVTTCTVAVDNDDLLAYLGERREVIAKLKDALPHMNIRIREDNIDKLKAESNKILNDMHDILRPLRKMFGVPALCKKLEDLNDKIVEAAQKDHAVTSVFIMFETEKAQRYVLKKLVVPKVHVHNNNTDAVPDPRHVFRNNLVLDVTESEEPSTIRWKELHLKPKDFVVKILTSAVVFGMILASAVIVKLCDDASSTLSANAVAILNILFPFFAKFISDFERHSREEHFQVWLYFKIAFFRWVNTAVVITLITPFTATVLAEDGGTLPLVYKIFKAEIISSSIFQWLDPVAIIQKHFVAPRAATQDKMNLQFRGTEVFLAERYTNLTKIFFLTVWYCPLYPAVFFFAAAALFVNYFLDAFSLMRTWKPQPKLGESISHYTRSYVFPITILVMTIVARWSWSNFRFDYLCDTESVVSSDLFGTWQISLPTPNHFEDAGSNVTLSKSSTYHNLCSRNSWQTDEQAAIVLSNDITSYILIAVLSLASFIAVANFARKYYFLSYKPIGEDTGKHLRDVRSITGYVPQIPCNTSAYPLIACNINLDDGDTHAFIEWEDPTRTYEYYDLTKDATQLLERAQTTRGVEEVRLLDEEKPVFSRMMHWPYSDLDG